ncbi:unnamed protein product [Thelazia callipaeda]|uniref:Transposase n=1 Tax=Thelazia callipaeda TaxID=103827 RepID=A0A0N5CXG9_THECL|nr:unnamed protein product [Thelazia callipaeda]
MGDKPNSMPNSDGVSLNISIVKQSSASIEFYDRKAVCWMEMEWKERNEKKGIRKHHGKRIEDFRRVDSFGFRSFNVECDKTWFRKARDKRKPYFRY